MENENQVIKKKFEIKIIEKNGYPRNAIFIDDELLDWEVDMNSLTEAMKQGPEFFKIIRRDIENHFLESVSELLGRKVTAADVNLAEKTGYI